MEKIKSKPSRTNEISKVSDPKSFRNDVFCLQVKTSTQNKHVEQKHQKEKA